MASSPRMRIVPVFIPHSGCPHRCAFCDQTDITGNSGPPSPEEAGSYLAAHLGAHTPDAVIAFYGGSFTCLPRELQDGYLGTAARFIEKGYADYVRLSTRPDCIDADTVSFLYARGVRVVELGAQSMDDRVLAASARGHTATDTVNAAALIKASGMELGIQIMAGLPCDSRDGFVRTARLVATLGPDFVRIYPALVLKGAPLERLYSRGEYAPLALDDAVSICADAYGIFGEADIKVARTGLQPGKALEASLVAGPYHPSFGHLVSSELALRRMVKLVESEYGGDPPDGVEFRVHPAELSGYMGINRANLVRLRAVLGRKASIRPDDKVARGGLALVKAAGL